MKRSLPLLACAALAAAALATAAPASGAAPADPRARAVEHALAAITSHRAATASTAADAFAVRDVVLDADGAEHVRLARSYRGLPVLGGDMVVHRDARGGFAGVSKTQSAPLSLSTKAATTADAARAAALRLAPGAVDSVSAPALAVTTRTATPRLVWTTVVSGTDAAGGPSELRLVLDAADLSLVDSEQGIETAKPGGGGGSTTGSPVAATGRALYLGDVPLSASLSGTTYSLVDQGRGGATTSDLGGRTSGSGTLVTSTTPVFGDSTTANRATVAADAAYGIAQTWDYYKTLGRNGIDGFGRGAASRVHYGRSYNNAFWNDSCFCMSFGDGDGRTFTPLVSLDVAGHEMTHGVTSRSANLTYSGESGGLNEGTSDIFGTMVEFYAANGNDVPDYTIGEEIDPTGRNPLRYMAQPSLDGASKDCWYNGVGSLDVHYSSGPANHVFYLLAQGSSSSYGASPVCSNAAGVTAVTGIGNDAAAKIWYRALTVYMTSSTDYHGARTAALKAATDLYGAGSAQYNGVANAFAGINVT